MTVACAILDRFNPLRGLMLISVLIVFPMSFALAWPDATSAAEGESLESMGSDPSTYFAVRYFSLTKGRRLLLFSADQLQSASLRSNDTSVVSTDGGAVIGRKVGHVTIYALRKDLSTLVDSCEVTVVPWIAGITNMNSELLINNALLGAMSGDTMFVYGQGGSLGWKTWYKTTVGASSHLEPILTIESDGTFPYDPEQILPTPWGQIVLGKRYSLNSPRAIYKRNFDSPSFRVVYDKFPLFGDTPTYSYVMQNGWSYDKKGNIYLGEYNSDDVNLPAYRIKIFKSSDRGETWDSIFTFAPRNIAGLSGGVRHVHAAQVDPFTQDVWICTGDDLDQPRIYYHRNQLLPDSTGHVSLSLLAHGSQDFRVVSMAFTERYIYWFTDAPNSLQKIFRIRRSSNYPSFGPEVSAPELQIVSELPDKAFRHNIEVQTPEGRMFVVGTSYENVARYGNSFRELDPWPRVFALKEYPDGSVMTQEVFAPRSNGYTALYEPVGQDSHGDVYFWSNYISESAVCAIYKGSFEWKDFDTLQVRAPQLVNTYLSHVGVTVSANCKVNTTLFIHESTPTTATVPENVHAILPRSWKLEYLDGCLDSMQVAVDLNKVLDYTLSDSIVVLVRFGVNDTVWHSVNSGQSSSQIITGIISGSCSEFALGLIGPPIQVSPDHLSFGEVVPKDGVVRRFSIEANKTKSVRIQSLKTKTSAFRVLGSTPALLQNDRDTLWVSIEFSPPSPGRYLDTLEIETDFSPTPYRISLSGDGDTGLGVPTNESIPRSYSLSTNYPNPFNPSTSIRVGLPEESIVLVQVFDNTGRLIATVFNGKLSAGITQLSWIPSRQSSGVYIIRLRANSTQSNRSFWQSRKMILLR